jgi:hypothetical protein
MKNSALKARHTSLPMNSTRHTKMKEIQDRPKTFFKGATEFLQGGEYSALADKDETLKKILDDQAVVRVYEDRERTSLVQDYINRGLLPEKALKSKRNINLNSVCSAMKASGLDSRFSDMNSARMT